MIAISKESIESTTLDSIDYHYMFPIAIETKYELDMTSLTSYQLDLKQGVEFIQSCSRYNCLFQGVDEILEQNEVIAYWFKRLYKEAKTELVALQKTDRPAFVKQLSQLWFASMTKVEYLYPWRLKFEYMQFEAYEKDAIALKFAEIMAQMALGREMTVENCLPEFQAYLECNLQKRDRYTQGLEYYWVHNLTNAFCDAGVLIVNEDTNYLVFLQLVNNQ